jgi:hypothetical protein
VKNEAQFRLEIALHIAFKYAGNDGAHHKDWVIDQMVRALTGCPLEQRQEVAYTGKSYTYMAQGRSQEYLEFVAAACKGEDGPDTYSWSEGIPP